MKRGEILKQPELAKTLKRIADDGPAGFYEGETAELLVQEMQAGGGIITKDDLKGYVARKRKPIRGNYRGYENHFDAPAQLRRRDAGGNAEHPGRV